MPLPSLVADDARVSDPKPSVLFVWNPLYEPRTVEAHVTHLREREATWWGRIYGRPGETPPGPPGETIRKLVEASAEHLLETLERQGEATVLVTNYVSLHALRVTEVRVGEEATRPPEEEIPDYYRGARVILWLRVTDVRALFYDQASTLAYLREVKFDRHLLDAKKAPGTLHPYDPFASMAYAYPLPISLDPSADSGWSAGSEPGSRFVDQEEAAFPRSLLSALGELHAQLPALWPKLSFQAQLLLATGRTSQAAFGPNSRYGVGPAVLGLASAVESELRDRILDPLRRSRDADLSRAQETLSILRGVLTQEAAPQGLGAMRVALGKLAKPLRGGPGAEVLPALVSLEARMTDGSPMDRLRCMRNDVAHAKRLVSAQEFEDVWEQVVTTPREPLLGSIADACEELLGLGLA